MVLALISLTILSCKSDTSNKDDAESTEINTVETIEFDRDSILNVVMGKFDPSQHPDFVLIDTPFTDKEGLYLHWEAYSAFKEMFYAARLNGISLKIISATRPFNHQKGIWERKWTGETILSDGTNASRDIPDPADRALKILEFSSMPGTSRHHWGTDLDINALNNSYFESGQGLKEYNWLIRNASSFGFCQTYTAFGKGRKSGYQEEKWHWSYTPVSARLTFAAAEMLTDSMISGFEGDEAAAQIKVVKNYVLGVNRGCLE